MKRLVTFLFFSFSVVVCSATTTFAASYYFNNAVSTDPTVLGNYWDDYGATDPASSLPDLSVDELSVLPGATYTGNAIFRDFGYNEGTVDGNATFYESNSGNYGTVTGTKTRVFAVDTFTLEDYISTGPWTIVADGIELDVRDAQTDGTTTLVELNGGTFINATFVTSSFINNKLGIRYTKDIDTNSVPSTSDFVVEVDGSPVSVTGVSISGRIVTLTLATSPDLLDTVVVDYTKGLNPIKSSGASVPSFSNKTSIPAIFVGIFPYSTIVMGTKLYVSNQQSDTVSVIDTENYEVTDTISVGDGPQYSNYITWENNVYISNSGSANISVIDATTESVVDTISTGTTPYFTIAVGNKLYTVNNSGDSVTVINADTNDVSSTISVGDAPYYLVQVGSKIYTANFASDNVSVINTETDDVSSTITVGNGPQYLAVVGTKIYVTNVLAGTVSVINTLTDTVSATITVGTTPNYIRSVGTKLYVVNEGSNNVSVINTTNNTVSSTISVGTNPYHALVSKDKLYVTNRDTDSISIIDTDTDAVVDTITVGDSPYLVSIVGSYAYVNNLTSGSISVINTENIPSLLPSLTSFSSSSASGTYEEGDNISIIANFGQTLQSGSTMTVLLNTGRSVVLNNISGSTLSGTYTVQAGDETPDLAIESISSASVTDGTNTRTSYELPSSQGDYDVFEAENSFITRNLGDSKNIVIGSFQSTTVGSNPYQISAPVSGHIYVANQGSDDVSVIDVSDFSVVDTIDVGSEPYGLTVANGDVYVANTGSDTVSVIDTGTNAVTSTISVGVKPYYAATIGTNVYITNSMSNTVSVINSLTNTVTATIPVGLYPRGIKAYGTDLYVANYGDENNSGGNSVSVINSLDNTVTETIILPAEASGPRGVTVLGSKVYVTNFRSDNISIIDTADNTVEDSVDVGNGPRGIVGLGDKIYVENFDDGTISVIDTSDNSVTDTVDVGSSPSGMVVSSTDIYVSSFMDNKVRILDTDTNTLSAPLTSAPGAPTNIVATAGEGQVIVSFTAPASDGGAAITSYTVTSSPGSITASGSSSPITVSGLTNGVEYTFTVTATNSVGTSIASSASSPTTPEAPTGGGSRRVRVVETVEEEPIKSPSDCLPGYNFSPSSGVACKSAPVVPAGPIMPSTPVTPFNRDLKLGMSGEDVKKLQIYLNNHGFVVSDIGAGSPGKETTLFGSKTKSALIKYQVTNNINPSVGYFGPITRAKVNLNP